MAQTLLNIGFENAIVRNRVVGIASSESAPVKRLIQEAKVSGRLVNVASGRRVKSVIFTDTNQIFLSSLAAATLNQRWSESSESR